MGLDKPSTVLPLEIVRSICERKTDLSNYTVLPLAQGKEIVLHAQMSLENGISLSLRPEPKDNGQPVILENLGTYRIGEDMHEILHSLFSRLCIYTFLGVTQENINAVLKGLKPEKEEEENKLLSLNFKQKKIGKSSFETAFNILFIAVCYSCLIKQDNGNRYLKDKMKELASEMLEKIGKTAAQSLIKSLAYKRNQIHSQYETLKMDGLAISYSSVISKSISCYCTRLEMDAKLAFGVADKNNLQKKLNHNLFHCELGFDSVVKNNGDHIEVKHTIRFLHYKPIQLKSSTNSNERYFPAKISIKIWPEGDFKLINLLMGESTSDPSVTVTSTTCRESGLQAQLATTGASLTLVTKCNCSTAHTLTRTCWKRKLDIEGPGVGRQDWILEDKFSGVSAFDYKPCCRKAPAYKTLAGLARSNGPFTESGGIIFEGEERCGPPMTWELTRPPLKWAAEVEIGVAYYGPQYMEVRSKKFSGISLVQPIEDSIQQATLQPLVNNSPLKRTPVQHVGRTVPHPNQQQVPRVKISHPQHRRVTSAPHTTEQQVPQRTPVQHVSRTAPRPNQQQVPPVKNSRPQRAPDTSASHPTEQQMLLGALLIFILIWVLNKIL